MPNRDIVVIGGSAGALEVLRPLLQDLAEGFPASVLVVLHVSPDSSYLMPELLYRNTGLRVIPVHDRDPLERGRLYIAPPDRHLVLEADHVRLTKAPRENRFRPAVDPLFRSAAQLFGPRVIGVILSGSMDDGTAGLWAIKARGGVTVVQDPQDAEYSSMPQSAIDHVKVDHVVKAQEMGALLHRLTAETVQGNGGPVSENLNIESAIAREAYPLDNGVLTLGPPTDLTCPECHGVLRQVKEGDILRYRCHTGHAFSADSLLAEITQSLESTLWSTLRSVEESVLLLTRMVEQLQRSGAVSLAHKAQQKMEEVSHRAMTIRQVILAHEHLSLELLGKE